MKRTQAALVYIIMKQNNKNKMHSNRTIDGKTREKIIRARCSQEDVDKLEMIRILIHERSLSSTVVSLIRRYNLNNNGH